MERGVGAVRSDSAGVVGGGRPAGWAEPPWTRAAGDRGAKGRLAGFTLAHGATRSSGDCEQERGGGGVFCASASTLVSNCVLLGNAASATGGGAFNGRLTDSTLAGNSAYSGGGASFSTLNNCTLTGNSAVLVGGGAESATLSNCWVAGNFAYGGGGVSDSALTNCTLSLNSAFAGGGGADYSTLYSCVVTNNSAPQGGGAAGGTLTRCVLTGNQAANGGGAASADLHNCILSANRASQLGGGGLDCTLDNCLAVDNQAAEGGGASSSTLSSCTVANNSASDWNGGADMSVLNNSIVYYNTAPDNIGFLSTYNCCCAFPSPFSGTGHFTNAPLFVDLAAGDFHLQNNSPCINAGLNAYVSGATDLAGSPRIAGGTVDLGAYEFQNPSSSISYAWLQRYRLPTDGSADAADPDTDGMKTWQEWVAGTDPTNGASVLRLQPPIFTLAGVPTLTWSSVTNRSYSLELATNLSGLPAFSLVGNNITGQTGTTSFTDTNGVTGAPCFYRVRVER